MDITAPNLDFFHFGENFVVFKLLYDLVRRDPKWVLSSVEERGKSFVLGKSRGTTHSFKINDFCPMLKDKRDAVRVIAEKWKLAVISECCWLGANVFCSSSCTYTEVKSFSLCASG
ncbi:hypothetical protein L6164_008115 [Bauhinia variegata]|uniref:Uncharacterized protein n=1 Tax=Bauhinia variegata TaxID=167791 RepID=A0ACB9PFI4_BAUVA|nr:hypothetical protein L6164_008115 [Bauhinia variegata]